MSDSILPLAVWEEGTLQNDVPANDNSLRLEALSREVLGVANSPAFTYDGAVYIVGAAPSGDFATFDPDDLTIYRGGTWYAWAPVDGIVVYIGTDPYQYSGSSGWTDIGGGTGAVSSVNGHTGVVVLALDDLDDVNAAAPSDGDVLTWDSGASEWVPDTASASVAWGGITGTLSSQTDLQSALDAKAARRDAVTALSISSGVVNIDCSLGDFFTLSLTANVTSITFSNLPASGKACALAIRIRQDGTGSRTVALPSSFKATGGSDTAVQSAANAYTLLTITTFDQGTRWEYAMQEIAA